MAAASPSDAAPISAHDARSLFADWKKAPALMLAVSGGPDSVALLWLVARWRRSLRKDGPRLLAVTVDHRLRRDSAREARDVARLAAELGIPHRTLRWTGDKPAAGLPAAAREARYRLLARAARAHGATHVLVAHTRDDQAETVLMRMARGSGLSGLAAMARHVRRGELVISRPFLDVPKASLIATLRKAGIAYAVDPTNADTSFTRPRLRALMPRLAEEGFDARNLARLATRMARADVAIEGVVDAAARYLALRDPDKGRPGFDARGFAALPEEIRLRLLIRTINQAGHEGPAELGKVESLLGVLDRAIGLEVDSPGQKLKQKLKRTLAGAVVSLDRGRLRIEPAPLRRSAGAGRAARRRRRV